MIRGRVSGSRAIDSAAKAVPAKTRIGSRSRTRPSSAKQARIKRVSRRRAGRRRDRRESVQRTIHSAMTAKPKMRPNANAASPHSRRAAVSEICSRAQPIRRGASRTIATPARISPEKASICCDNWPNSAAAAGLSASAPRFTAINARSCSTSLVRAASSCKVCTSRSSSSTETGAGWALGDGSAARAPTDRAVGSQNSSKREVQKMPLTHTFSRKRGAVYRKLDDFRFSDPGAFGTGLGWLKWNAPRLHLSGWAG